MLRDYNNTNGYKWVKFLFCPVTYYSNRNSLVSCRIFPGRESRKASKREIKKKILKKKKEELL